MKFCQLCRKNFAEDWKKFLLNEKKIWITTFQRKWLSIICCYGDANLVLKIVPKKFAPNVCIVSAHRPETVFRKSSLKNSFWSKTFLRTHRMQNWRNWEIFPPRDRKNLAWSPKVVKALYNFSKQYFPQFVSLA